MAERSVGRTVGNLVLALTNATLILVALCLWLAWSTLSVARDVSDRIGAAAETVIPMRAELVRLTEEVAGARADLAALRRDLGGAPTAMAGLEARVGGVEAQLSDLNATIAGLDADPEALIEGAIGAAFEGLAAALATGFAGAYDTPEGTPAANP
jgi:hypothetical protein